MGGELMADTWTITYTGAKFRVSTKTAASKAEFESIVRDKLNDIRVGRDAINERFHLCHGRPGAVSRHPRTIAGQPEQRSEFGSCKRGIGRGERKHALWLYRRS